MTEEEVRRYIAGEIRAEAGRQERTATACAAALGKSRQALQGQWRGVARYRAEELLTLASFFGVDVRKFLPRGYRLAVVEVTDELTEVAS